MKLRVGDIFTWGNRTSVYIVINIIDTGYLVQLYKFMPMFEDPATAKYIMADTELRNNHTMEYTQSYIEDIGDSLYVENAKQTNINRSKYAIRISPRTR